MQNSTFQQNSIILQNVTLGDIEAMITKAIDSRLKSIQPATPIQPTSDGLVTRKEAAKRLRISLVTLDNWTKLGLIKAKRIGSRVRYTPKDIEDALKNASK